MSNNSKAFQEEIGRQVVDIAFHIHKALGPGLLESVYEKCFCYELGKREIRYVTQKKVSIVYDSIIFEEGLRLDLLIEDMVIVELKAQENSHPVWEAQLLSYLRFTNKQLGYIINFTVPLIKNGIKRMVLSS
jgi:GxxExxY protein